MTITLKPETQRAIEEAARQRGVTPDDVVEETMARELAVPPAADDELRARVKAARGSLAYLGPSTLMQERKQEKALEERRWTPDGNTSA